MSKLLEVEDLKVIFNTGKNEIRAVDGVSFGMSQGEVLGIVGESGCGKSTIGRTILGLHHPTSGGVLFEGENIKYLGYKQLSRGIQMIFQDPFSSLNPRMTVGDIVAEGIDIHRLCSTKEERKRRVSELLEDVGLDRTHAMRYPHEFSGGQRQRIGIARALAVAPKVLICDEPISALDVSIQAQVVNLLIKLQKEKGLTILFIAHDLALVKYISDRILVMNNGKIVEEGFSEELYKNPKHPYTKLLLSSMLTLKK